MKKWTIMVILYIIFSFSLIMLYLPVNNLHPDEAHYWVWSTRLQAGYFDNSPLIAFFIQVSTLVFGNNEFAVRFPAASAYLILSLILYLFAVKVTKNKKVALLSVFLLGTLPIILVGTHVITHDVPLMVFASLTWFFLFQAIVEKKYNRWYIAGLFFGLALLSKYQAVLIGISVFSLLILVKDFRPQLQRKEPYIAALIALALFSPTFYWNSQNNWISFLFQFRHGVQTQAGLKPLNVLEFYVGQMGVTSAIYFLALIYYTLKKFIRFDRITPEESFLIGGFLPTLIFFSFTSLTYTALANWPLAAYFTASVFIANNLIGMEKQEPHRHRLGLAIFIILFVVGSWLPVSLIRYNDLFERLGLKLPPQAILTDDLYGWRDLGQALEEVIDQHSVKGEMVPIFAEKYATSSEILFYTKRSIKVMSTPWTRLSQFDLWTLPEIDFFAGKNGFLVAGNRVEKERLQKFFSRAEEVRELKITRNGRNIRTLYIYKLEGIKAEEIVEGIRNKGIGY